MVDCVCVCVFSLDTRVSLFFKERLGDRHSVAGRVSNANKSGVVLLRGGRYQMWSNGVHFIEDGTNRKRLMRCCFVDYFDLS